MNAVTKMKITQAAAGRLSAPMAEHPYNYIREHGAQPTRPRPPRYQLTTLTTRLREFLAGDFRDVRLLETPTIAGDYGDRLFDAAWEGDPLMDAVVQMFNRMPRGEGRKLLMQALDHGIDSVEDPPEELANLFAQLDHIPDWMDWDLLDTGAIALHNSSYLAFFLGMMLGSVATAGSQSISLPVGMTGRFKKNTVNRVVESVTFYNDTSCKDGLKRFGAGFKSAVNVRLMHALVRARMVKSEEGELFDYARNGNPMNQADTAFGIPFFGLQIGVCERAFGGGITEHDLDGMRMHWGYIGYLLGVRDDIIPKNLEEAFYLMDVMWATLGAPSKYTLELYDTLFSGFEDVYVQRHPQWAKFGIHRVFDVLHAYARYMLGDTFCNEIGSIRRVPHLKWLPKSHARAAKLSGGLLSAKDKGFSARFVPGGGEINRFLVGGLKPTQTEAVASFSHHDNLTRDNAT